MTEISDDGLSYIIGVFIANDRIIAASVEDTNLGYAQFLLDKAPPEIFPSAGSLDANIEKALCLCIPKLPADAKVPVLVVAISGPLHHQKNDGLIAPGIIQTRLGHYDSPLVTIDTEKHRTHAVSVLERHGISGALSLEICSGSTAYALGDYFIAKERYAHSEIERNNFRESAAYAHITIDQQVSGAIVAKDDLLQSALQSELGHLPIRRHIDDDHEQACQAHRFEHCLESMIGLPALQARWGVDVLDQMKMWDQNDSRLKLIGFYVAQLCVSLVLTVAPTHIAFSGRAMDNQNLISVARRFTRQLLQMPNDRNQIYPGYPALSGDDFMGPRQELHAGVFGCLIKGCKKNYRNIRVIR